MIHHLTYVHPDAKIGNNVTVEPFSYIAGNVEIGDGTWIGPNVTILDGARIGKNCRIFPGAVISAIPQDLKFVGEETTAEIGDNTTIRECVTINRGTKAKWKTVVGSNCLLMAYVHVAHDDKICDYVIIGNGTQLAGEVDIDNHAILSAHVLVHQFVRIGEHVIISGGSLVRKDIPPYVKAAHEPVAYVGLNTVGLRRRSFPNETIYQLQDAYRILYQQKLSVKNAVAKIREEIPQTPELDYMLTFIEGSKRGLMKGYTGSLTDED
jgi:UDP-N-acetylglucosamine acyltransferase